MKARKVPLIRQNEAAELEPLTSHVVHLMLPTTDIELWSHHPTLSSFCIFYAGFYVEAKRHFWHRNADDPDGVFIYCTAGRGFYRYNGKEWPVSAGELIYAPPLTEHSYGTDDTDPWTIYWMHVRGRETDNYAHLLGFTPERPVIEVGIRPRTIALFQTVFEFLKPPMSDAKMAFLSGAGRQLLASMALEGEKQASSDAIAAGIKRVLEAMEKQIHEQACTADWLKLFGGSRSHFQRQFRHVTGQSPKDFFLRLKIQAACRLLAGSDLRVAEIATRIGIPDTHYFSRLFRRMTGHTAVDYRHQATTYKGSPGAGQTHLNPAKRGTHP